MIICQSTIYIKYLAIISAYLVNFGKYTYFCDNFLEKFTENNIFPLTAFLFALFS